MMVTVLKTVVPIFGTVGSNPTPSAVSFYKEVNNMAEGSIIPPELQAKVGYETSFVDEHEMEKGMFKRFAITIGDPNPLYCDEEYAKKTAYGGVTQMLTKEGCAQQRLGVLIENDLAFAQ